MENSRTAYRLKESSPVVLVSPPGEYSADFFPIDFFLILVTPYGCQTRPRPSCPGSGKRGGHYDGLKIIPPINPSEPSPIITSNTLRSTYVRIVYNSAISIIYGNIPLEYRGSSHSRGPAMLPMHKSHRDVGWQSSTRLFIFKSRNTDWSSTTHAVSHGGHNLQRKSVREIEKDCNRLSCTEHSVSPKKVTDQQN